MTENTNPETEYSGFRERLTRQFEGVSDEDFLAKLQQSYETGGGMSFAQYDELVRRREDGLDIASYSTDLAESVAEEDARIIETITSFSETLTGHFKGIQWPTFDFSLSLPETTSKLPDPIDLDAFLVPRDPNAVIVNALEVHREKLEAIEKNTGDTADAVAIRLQQVENENIILKGKLEAIEKNTGDTADAVAIRLQQVEKQGNKLRNRFIITTSLALLGFTVAVIGLIYTLKSTAS